MKSMTAAVPPISGTSFIRWWSRLCLLLGSAVLVWAVYLWFDANLYQMLESRKFEAVVSSRNPDPAESAAAQPTTSAPAAEEPARTAGIPVAKALRPAIGSVVGELEIPRIGLSVVVAEGDSVSILRRAAGHLERTALPGAAGNVAIAGHRDTFFHSLHGIRNNDIITVNTLRGSYQYQVESVMIVEPNDMTPLADSREPTLTLITCYPFYYIGPAPKRFIVRAKQISSDSRTELN